MEWLNIVSAIILSFVTIGISIYNLLIMKKQLYTNTVTAQRIEWINTVRGLVAEFIAAYIKYDRNYLYQLKTHIDLFLNLKNPDHLELSKRMMNYVEISGMDFVELTDISQIVFKNAWERMKQEAGFTDRQEKLIRDKIYANTFKTER